MALFDEELGGGLVVGVSEGGLYGEVMEIVHTWPMPSELPVMRILTMFICGGLGDVVVRRKYEVTAISTTIATDEIRNMKMEMYT